MSLGPLVATLQNNDPRAFLRLVPGTTYYGLTAS